MASVNFDRDVSRIDSYLKLTNETQFDKAIMFVGAVGAGKSTLCNFLVRRDNFETGGKAFAVTREAKCDIFPFEGQFYMIVDCPGFLESKEENERRVLGELCRAGVMARDGIDALAFVINLPSRFREKSHKQAMHILNTIGANFWNYTFLIFTHEDQMLTQASSTEEYLKDNMKDPKTSELLFQIFQQANRRYMCIESKRPVGDTRYWEEKCCELVGHMNFISEMNENRRFESVMMSKGKEFYFKCVDLKNENQKLQEEISELKSLREKEVDRNEELEKRLDELNSRVPEVNRNLGKEAANYEKDMDDVIFSKETTGILLGATVVGVAAFVGVTLLKALLK